MICSSPAFPMLFATCILMRSFSLKELLALGAPTIIAAVSPRDAVISSGVRNRFGHPHPRTLRTLASAGIRVFRTDQDGAVSVWTDGARVNVTTAGGEHRSDLW